MLAITPVDVTPLECDLKPYTVQLFADAAKKRPVTLPPGTTWRKCADAREGAQVLTKPDSGGTEICVVYALPVDPKNPDIQITPRMTAITKSRPDKSCPSIDYGRQSYPGKEWFFLGDNVTLPNAFKLEAKVEKDGLAFLKAEQQLPNQPGAKVDYGNSPLGVFAIAAARTIDCRHNAGVFQGRYPACFKVEVYNQTVRGGLNMVVALTKKGDFEFIKSERSASPAPAR